MLLYKDRLKFMYILHMTVLDYWRMRTIKFGSLVSFIGSIFFYFAIFTGNVSTLSIVLYSGSIGIVLNIGMDSWLFPILLTTICLFVHPEMF